MPKRFNIIQSNDVAALKNQINQNFAMLDKEVETKTFFDRNTGEQLIIGNTGNDTSGMTMKGEENEILTIGRFAQSRYGLIGYDSTGTARILLGMSPDDGRMGLWITKDGYDVIDLLD